MTPMILIAALLQIVPLAPPPPGPATLPDSNAPPPSNDLCDQPAVLVVTGPADAGAAMIAYHQGAAQAGLLAQLGGYALNDPRAIERLAAGAGDASASQPARLILRFPCSANARAYWNAPVHRDQLTARDGNAALPWQADLYREAPLPDVLVGRVGDNGYRASFDAAAVAQQPPR